MSRVIGIDFGLKHWGLAQGIAGIIEPIGTIDAVGGIPVWEELHQKVKPWFSAVWVLGLPLDRQGELLLAGRVLQRHWRTIKKNLTGEVILVDEYLSSIEAKAYLKHNNKKFNKQEIDSLSACLILENYYMNH